MKTVDAHTEYMNVSVKKIMHARISKENDTYTYQYRKQYVHVSVKKTLHAHISKENNSSQFVLSHKY